MKIASNSYRYRILTIPFLILLNCLNIFDVHGIEVSGSVSGDWILPNSPYIVTADATVPLGESLTVQPGVVVKFRSTNTDLFVDGVLNAIGTAALPITFTTENPNPMPLQWGSILFRNTNGEEVSRLEHCQVSYGSGFRSEMIQINGARVEMRHCDISNSGTIGISILNANPVITDCQLDANVSYAMAMTPGTSPSFSGNQAHGNGADVIGIHGGTITGEIQWVRDALPYRVINDVTVLAEGQLTIAPGVVVEFQDASDDLFIDGTLIAEGNASNRIRFTSSKTEKAPNQWGAVLIRDTSNDVETRLNYCDFEYGGAFRAELLALQQSSPTVEHCRFSSSRDRGMTLQGSSSRIAFNEFQSNTSYAIVMDLASFPVFEQNSVDGNGSNSIGVEGGDTRNFWALGARQHSLHHHE